MKQIKNLVCSLLLSVCGATMFTACSEDNEAINAKDLELSKSELVFLAEPGEAQTVTFTANADWKATSEQGWILIDTPVGKKGESAVSVSVKQNPEKVSRQGNVIITEPSTGKMASFKVTQEAEGVNFAIDKREGHFVTDLEAKTFTETFNVVANFEYEIQIVDADWINYSINEGGDIVFNVDTRKVLPTEAKSVKVNFVSIEEDASTESITILWDGYEPYIKFYSDEECTNEISAVEFDQKGNNTVTYIKSNVPWTFSKEESEQFTSLISYDRSEDMTRGEKLPYAIETTASLFVNYDRTKLSDKDQTLKLKFVHGEIVKELAFSKKGYSIYFDESQFRTLVGMDDPKGVPTFPALPVWVETPDGGRTDGLSIEFEVLAAYEVEPIIFKKNGSDSPGWNLSPSLMAGAVCEPLGNEKYNENLTKYKYRLKVNDRSKGSEGEKLDFKLYIAKKIQSSTGPLFMQYFDDLMVEDLKPTKNLEQITSGMDFSQTEYYTTIDFNSTAITKDGVSHSISANGVKNYELKYELSDDYWNIQFYSKVTLINDGLFIDSKQSTPINPADPSSDTNNIITSFFKVDDKGDLILDNQGMPIWSPLYINVSPNTTNAPRNITIYFAYMLSNGNMQYLGKFTINQAAASSTPEQ